jgi:hypothetical protein
MLLFWSSWFSVCEALTRLNSLSQICSPFRSLVFESTNAGDHVMKTRVINIRIEQYRPSCNLPTWACPVLEHDRQSVQSHNPVIQACSYSSLHWNRWCSWPYTGYADEIKTWMGGWGMDGLLHSREYVLKGITNGIDEEWVATTIIWPTTSIQHLYNIHFKPSIHYQQSDRYKKLKGIYGMH